MFVSRCWALLVAAALLGGCATYKPTELHRGEAIFGDKSKVAVLVTLPETPNVLEVDPERGGGGFGLLQLAVVSAVTSKLTAHAKSLPMDDLRGVEAEIVAALGRKGLQAEVVKAETLKDWKPESFEAKDGTFHHRDLRPLRQRLGVDRLLTVKVDHLGFNYPFSGVIPIPTGDPMAWVAGEAHLVDLRTNAFQWYRKLRTLRGVGKAWDEPPHFKALTAKYYEVLELAKDELVADLVK